MSSFEVEQGMTLAAAEPVDSTSGLLEVYNMLKESSTPATFKDEDETHAKSSADGEEETILENSSTKVSSSSGARIVEASGTSPCKLSFPWSKTNHLQFIFAIFDFAVRKASPKKLLKLMPNAPTNLTTEHVKSHLQKFRVHFRKTRDPEFEKVQAASTQPLDPDELQKYLTVYPIQLCALDYMQSKLSDIKEMAKVNFKQKFKRKSCFESAAGERNSKNSRGFDDSSINKSHKRLRTDEEDRLQNEMSHLMSIHQQQMRDHQHNMIHYSYSSELDNVTPDGPGNHPGGNGVSVEDALGALTSFKPGEIMSASGSQTVDHDDDTLVDLNDFEGFLNSSLDLPK
jgi:SHAQKYF class myb-like DNA-binding protein